MKLLLIDGNSVLYRAYYATAYGSILKTSTGIYTNAIYAFANMLNKALKTINPIYCVVAFDKSKHTFRHDIAEDYKGGRKETPPELVMQFPIVREMMDAYNIPYLEYENFEADDILGTLSKKFDVESCILSSDRDLLQLIDDTTYVYMMKKGMSEIKKMDREALKEDYGLRPDQIPDYKGLAGDKSDNIKGVDGVGDKTATKLLNDYDTCEGIYEHIEEIKGKLKEKLIADKDNCMLSKKLATIKTDVDIEFDLEKFRLDINEDSLNAFFNKYEMYSLIKASNNKKSNIKVDLVEKISSDLLEDSFIYFACDDFDYYNRHLYGMCICKDEKIEYIDYRNMLNDEGLLNYLTSDKHKITYDLKSLLHLLKQYHIKLGDNVDDVLLMSFLSNNYYNSLATICGQYGYSLTYIDKELFGTEKKQIEPNEDKLMHYCAEVSYYLYKVYEDVKNDLIRKDMVSLYKDVELKLSYVLFEMEDTGIICDNATLQNIANETQIKINDLTDKIYQTVGHEFNINSPLQLKNVLYDELDLPDFKKGSTNAEVLAKLVDYHPVVSLILDYRKYSKLYSTYADGLQKYISKDGRIHTIFSQTITQTGRLSSYDPNLQNISIRDDESSQIRKAFLADSDSVLIGCDYSQIELRVLASLANEENMIDAFNKGIDIHKKTAMKVFDLKEEEVTSQHRRHAKAINFGVVYGISDFGLANQTNLSFIEAKNYIDLYFETYPKIKEFLDEQIDFCSTNGYVKTILNRRRYIDDIKSSKFQLREFGKRAARNSTIQGSAADIIKLAMIKVNEEIKKHNLKSKLVLQIHDELVFNVLNDEKEQMIKIIQDSMSNAYKLKVRLDTSLAIGNNLFEAK